MLLNFTVVFQAISAVKADMSGFSLPIVMIVLAMLSIQFGASVAKQLFSVIGVGAVTGFRLFFAAFILLGIWRPWRKKLAAKSWKSILIYGVSLGLMNLLFYLSLERIPLGLAVGLEFTGPLAVALFLSRKPYDFIWATLAALGIYLILPVSTLSTSLDAIGIFFAFAAGACWGLYILFGKSASQQEDLGAVTSLGMLIAALVVVPFVLALTDFSKITFSIFPLGIAIAILSSAIPYSFEMVALKKIPTKTFGILMSMEPAVAALMGYLNLKEHLTFLQMTAILFIITASLGASLTSRK